MFVSETEFYRPLFFSAQWYCVSTVGLDVQMIRDNIKNQEREEKRQEQMKLEGL